jgi:surfactin synthase thioesterase subunit
MSRDGSPDRMAEGAVRFFPAPKPAARAVVLAFPHAGGGASAFASWPARLPGWLDLCAFAVPGREGRGAEAPCRTWTELAALAERAASAIDLPIVLLGHSFGALVAHEVAGRLARQGRAPLHLFVAAARPPHLGAPGAGLRSDDEFLLAYVRALGGTSEDVLRNSELRESLLASLRADFAAAAGYRLGFRERIPVDATILCGQDDPGLSPSEGKKWGELLGGDTRTCVFPGGHFFVHEARDRVIASIIGRLRPERAIS